MLTRMTELPDRDYDLDTILETYRQDGSLMRAKARIILEEAFLPKAYARLNDNDVTTSAAVDLAKILVDIGDVKPKPSNTPTQAGAGFSITINIPQPNGEPPITIEAESTEAPCSSDEHDTQDTQIPGTIPTNFNTPAMDFNFDLGASVPALPPPGEHSGATDEARA